MSLQSIAIATGLIVFSGLEWRWPFFHDRSPQGRGWSRLATHLELAIISLVTGRYSTALLFQFLWPRATELGIFHGNQGLGGLTMAVLVLDFYIYLWHRLMHSTAWGWRLHQVHHCDRHLTTTSAYRFHPLEVLLSQLPQILLTCLLGVSPTDLLIYKSFYSVGLLFHHSNWALPPAWDWALSFLIVTPHYHRHHHSQIRQEQESNYASFLTLWDLMCGSRQYPEAPEQIRLGVAGQTQPQHLLALLRLPFNRPKGHLY